MRRWIGGTVATLAVLACAWWIWTASLEREIDRKILALRRAGLPTDRHCFTQAPIPPGDDAAPLYAEFATWCREHPFAAFFLREPEEYEKEDWEAAQGWLREAAPAIDTLHRAVERPACTHPYEMRRSLPMWVFGLITTAMDARDLVEVQVDVALHDGPGFEAAVSGIEALWALARHIDDRTVIGALVRYTTEEEACRLLRRVAGAGRLDPGRLRRLVDAWLLRDPGRTVEEVLEWERAVPLDALGFDPVPDVGDAAVPHWLYASLPYRPLLDLSLLHMLDSCDEGIRMVSHLDGARLATLLRKGRTLQERRWFEPFAPWGAWYGVALAYQRFRRAAWLNVTATGLDLLVHREAHGTWPETLAGFPDVTDPFTGEPLVYERTDTGVRVAALDPEPDEDRPLEWLLSD